MGEEDVRKAVEPLILEFFENNDSMEVLFTLQVGEDLPQVLLLQILFVFFRIRQMQYPRRKC